MGIRNLNYFLTQHCQPDSIKKTHLSEFYGKKIVIDASIYMYRFVGENKLEEQMNLMVSVLLRYNINPIFVFDGPPPPEKMDVLRERRKNKQFAQEKYEGLKQQFEEETDEMKQLKKQFVYITENDYRTVKSILNKHCVNWMTATGEADQLCAHMLHTGQAYACMSDDMDMFAYGCVRVLRHFSLIKHNVLMYDLYNILTDLQMNIQEFRQILILSGTDYNMSDSTSLFDSMNWFKKYKKQMILREGYIPTFYEWLLKYTKYIQNADKLYSVLEMFVPTH
jgi:5'-3' exonuclease